MSERVLIVVGDDAGAAPLLELPVLAADMPHPDWVRFELTPVLPEYERPVIVWYRVPEAARLVELHERAGVADLNAMGAGP